jgi:glycosyltransferase involved in cell wall biosynthesis
MARIVHVSESLATGVLSVLATLVNAQVLDGHEVVLIGSQEREDTLANWRDQISPKVQFINYPMVREISARADFLAALGLRKLFRRLRADVIHLHSSKAGALGRIAAIGFGARLFYQPHGLSYLRQDVSERKQEVFRWIERLLSLLGGTVVACSKGELAALAGVVSPSASALVLNGVSLAAVPRSEPKAGPVRVGTCGRISPQKGPLFFAEVARLVGAGASFVWIGDGDEADKSVLVQSGVRVTGWCTRAQALQHMAELDIYIQTSAWEGLPVSVIEAMAAGLPVIATDIVGNNELLKDSGAGELVTSPKAMAGAVVRFTTDFNLRRSAGENAYATAHELYSSTSMVNNFYRIYGLS